MMGYTRHWLHYSPSSPSDRAARLDGYALRAAQHTLVAPRTCVRATYARVTPERTNECAPKCIVRVQPSLYTAFGFSSKELGLC